MNRWDYSSNLKHLFTLKPRVKILNDFFVADTETGIRLDDQVIWQLRGRPENFIFGCIVGPKNFRKYYESRQEMVYDLLTNPIFKNKYVFFHNAEYDLNCLYDCIFKMDPTAIFNGSKFITCTNGNCKFGDSLNVFATSVKELGKMIGMEKTGMSGDAEYKKTKWNDDKQRARAINGCFRDCDIVYEGLFRIFETSGDIKITQASLSMTYYRRFHQPFIISYNSNVSYFWDSYYGGRTEALKIGKTNSFVIDANSMYPYWMKNSVFPNPKFLKVEKDIDIKYFIQNILPHYEGCIYATVFHNKNNLVNNEAIGFLPTRKDGKLIFPVGKFSGCWNFPEIRFALENNAIEILNISKCVYSEPMTKSPFESYVETVYAKRFSTTNEFEIYMWKIFMNSLYGKFAQRITEETIYIENIEKAWNTINEYEKKGIFVRLIPFNSERLDYFLILKSTKGINISYSIPSFSSYITSNARVHLLRKVLKMKNQRPVYMDTDSIFFEIQDSKFESSKLLGGWKKEEKMITEIRGLKNYKYINLEKDKNKVIHRIKGIPKLSDDTVEYHGELFKKSVKISDSEFQYFNLIKTKESLRRNLDAGILTKRNKKVTDKYDKRIVLNDGNTKPIEI
jgi:hypothetical protein